MNCVTSSRYIATDSDDDTEPLPPGFWRLVRFNFVVLLFFCFAARTALLAALQ